MYKYINIDNDTWLVYDLVQKRVVETTTPQQTDDEILSIDERLNVITTEPTAEEFEAWGRANMPYMKYDAEIDNLTSRKRFLEEVKNNIS